MKKHFRVVWAVVLAVLVLAGIFTAAFVNSNYYSAKKLVAAIEAEDIAAIKQILAAKPSCVNTLPTLLPPKIRGFLDLYREEYPLTMACFTGNQEIVQLLIASGADVNCYNGITPLSLTYSGKPENWYQTSLLLIESGASLDYVTEYSGNVPMILENIVEERGGAALPGYLPENAEEVNAAFHYALENCDQSKINWARVLQYSVSNERIKIVRFLLDEAYCDVNDTSGGMTPLMFAARDGAPEMVRLLLAYGADKSCVLEGMTAYDYAVEYDRTDVIPLLED